MALRIEICDSDGFSPSRKRADFLFNEGLKADLKHGDGKIGLILDIGGYYKNVITLAPNLLMTKEEIDIAADLLAQLLERVRKNGL
jgi:4-aminobutyrate aminotransferase-like enzyme